MSSYAEVDDVIEAWVAKFGAVLGMEWGGEPSRFFHLPGQPPHECFQVVIFPPAEGSVLVQAASIDTNDGAEMLETWKGPVKDLDGLLGKAVATIQRWTERPQGAHRQS